MQCVPCVMRIRQWVCEKASNDTKTHDMKKLPLIVVRLIVFNHYCLCIISSFSVNLTFVNLDLRPSFSLLLSLVISMLSPWL